MAESTCTPPREFRAGDSAHWRRKFDDYLASDGWVLAYTLVGMAAAHSIASSSDGHDFTVDVSAATSAGWAAGRYTLVEYVTKDTARHTLGTTTVQVAPNLAAATAGVDTRSHARRVLDNISAWLESKSVTAGETQLGDRRIRQYDIAELLKLRDRYAADVANEDAGGKGLVRRMLVKL